MENGITFKRVDTETIFQGYRLAFPENRAALDEWFCAQDEYWNW